MKGWTYKDLQNIMTEAELDQFAKKWQRNTAKVNINIRGSILKCTISNQLAFISCYIAK